MIKIPKIKPSLIEHKAIEKEEISAKKSEEGADQGDSIVNRGGVAGHFHLLF